MGTTFYNSIDDVLGDREGRYFGGGYTRCSQTISGFAMTDSGDGIEFTCLGSIGMSSNWSTKSTVRQEPHLSTIDVVELSLHCLQLLVRKTLHDHDVRAGMVQRISIVAGNIPVEDDLTSIPIGGRIKAGSAGAKIMDLQIANMEVSVDARRYSERLAAAGSAGELHVWQGMAHVFPANLALLRAAREATDGIGAFLCRQLVNHSNFDDANSDASQGAPA
ncbi:MAG: AvrD family protein [Devosia sp.]|nr:AvrD family protein [Devosia sp.]